MTIILNYNSFEELCQLFSIKTDKHAIFVQFHLQLRENSSFPVKILGTISLLALPGKCVNQSGS